MDLTLLCVGDVVGLAGRRVLRKGLAATFEQRHIDCVIVNAENAAGGSGLTASIYDKILKYGTNLITLGDHIYRRAEIIPVLNRVDNMVRPANLPADAPGRKFAIFETKQGVKVAVISVLGRMYMKPVADCPFVAVDATLKELPEDVKIVVVDMHAEATGEKVAMGWHLDGRVSVLFGTHTHIPTADETILPGGTAYITDLGMTGPYDSVLGRLKERVVSSLITTVPTKFDVAHGDPRLCGIIVSVDTETGKAKKIERIRFDGPTEADV